MLSIGQGAGQQPALGAEEPRNEQLDPAAKFHGRGFGLSTGAGAAAGQRERGCGAPGCNGAAPSSTLQL